MGSGRLCSQITVPSGGWTMTPTITAIGGPYTCTVPAGTYFSSTELLTAVQTALDGATGGDGAFTVSGSLTDHTGTGLVTIAHATQTFTLIWTSTDLRDVLGFTGTLTPAALTFTGTTHLRGVWLPDCPVDATYGSEAGHTEVHRSEMVGTDGSVSALCYGQSRVRQPRVAWSHVTRPRARISGETTTGASFERWWLDTHGGTRTYFPVAPQVRWYPDSGVATYYTYRLTSRTSTEMQRADASWVYLWPVEITGYKVPGS